VTWTFGPGGIYTAVWAAGVVTVTVTSGGALVGVFGGVGLATVAAAMALIPGLVAQATGGGVTSVNGQSGAVVLTPALIGALAAASNLSDLISASSARTNLGLGSAATQASSAFDAAGAAAAVAAQLPTSGSPLPLSKGGTGVSEVSASALLAALGITTPTASVDFKPNNPTGTTSTSLVMMGLGNGSTAPAPVVYTPTGTGKVMVVVTGFVSVLTTLIAPTVGARYALVGGGAPANGAAVTGTRFGSNADWQPKPQAAGSPPQAAFAFVDILSLTPSSQYYFDLAASTTNASDEVEVQGISISLAELMF
jgi:hypothetical protein